MSSYQLSLDPDLSAVTSGYVSRIPVHASFSSEADHLAILWECGYIEYWNLRTRLGPGPGNAMEPVKLWSGIIDGHNRSWRQLLVRALEEYSVIYVLGASQEADIIAAIKVNKDGTVNVQQRALSALQNSRMISVYPVIAVQDSKGKVYECTSLYSPYIYSSRLMKIVDPQTLDKIHAGGVFPEFCLLTRTVPASPATTDSSPSDLGQPLYIGLGAYGKLYITGTEHESKVLAPNATSFTIASGFIIYTTSAHDAWFVPLNVLQAVLSASEDEFKNMASTWETRKVERGSRIVVAVPSSMSLVLQMPRGNLENINPRPLVMKVVHQDLDVYVNIHI